MRVECVGCKLVVVVEVIVVVIVPIVLGVPAAGIDIPPTMVVVPAPRAGFGQFAAGMFRFFALRTVMFYGFVEIMVGFDDAFLAIIGRCLWDRKEKRSRQEETRDYSPRNSVRSNQGKTR
jgi:hypothetical protein